jgi:hypothetical protein
MFTVVGVIVYVKIAVWMGIRVSVTAGVVLGDLVEIGGGTVDKGWGKSKVEQANMVAKTIRATKVIFKLG